MAYADFNYYSNTYKGNQIKDEGTFCSLAERASDYIDSVTFDNITADTLADERVNDKIKRCCCALCDTILKYENHSLGKTIQSESNGKYSVTYAINSSGLTEINVKPSMKNSCLQYLGCTGLMYRGV